MVSMPANFPTTEGDGCIINARRLQKARARIRSLAFVRSLARSKEHARAAHVKRKNGIAK